MAEDPHGREFRLAKLAFLPFGAGTLLMLGLAGVDAFVVPVPLYARQAFGVAFGLVLVLISLPALVLFVRVADARLRRQKDEEHAHRGREI